MHEIDKNNEDFKTKENIKTNLLYRVDQLINFIKQINNDIIEYNQKTAKNSNDLKGELKWSN